MTRARALLHLIGRPRLEPGDGAAATILPCDRRSQLLVLLALRRDWFTRAELAAMLWPALPRPRALANLRKALHQARALPGGEAIEASAEAVRWLVSTDLDDATPARGRLLDGFDDVANDAWTAWIDAERATFDRLAQRRAHERLAMAEPAEAERLARELLAADPFDEDAVVALLAAQRALQRFNEQRAAYHAYAQRLDEELGVEPSQRVRAQLASAPSAPAVPPPDTDGLVGRGAEIDALLTALMRPATRVLVVTGPGGAGKSSLLKAALRQWPAAAAPPCWLPLDDLRDLSQAQARLAAELGLGPEADRDPAAAIAARLAEQPRLLAWDNCEHIDGIERLAQRCLDAHPQVRLVASSRRRLDLAQAGVLPLEGLSLPPSDASADALSRSDAWRLFVRAAREVKPALAVDGPDAAVIGRIVRRLGGLPLAILLAAPWVRHLELERIEADLAESLDLLESHEEGEERPEHRSQRATFDLSWRALTPREQRALAALSVFPGEASRAAALEVAEASPPLLAQLADKSLLRFSAAGRVSMHPLLRHFAAEKLHSAARDEVRRLHALFHLHWTAQKVQGLDRIETSHLREIGLELENLRQAWRWALAQPTPPPALGPCAVALQRHFGMSGASSAGAALLREALGTHAMAMPVTGAQIELALAQLLFRAGQLEAAHEHALRAIGQARRAGRRDLIGRGLLVVGGRALLDGRPLEARRAFEQAERLARSLHDARGVSLALSNLAIAASDLGDHDTAERLTTEILDECLAQRQWERAVVTHANLSHLRIAKQDWAGAREAAEAGRALGEREGIELGRPELALMLAQAALGQRLWEMARRHAGQAASLAQGHGNVDTQAHANVIVARALLAQGDLAAARTQLSVALPLARRAPSRVARLDLLLAWLHLAVAEGRADPARAWLHWYLQQPGLVQADAVAARECLSRLPDDGAREAVDPGRAPSLEQMLDRIEVALRE